MNDIDIANPIGVFKNACLDIDGVNRGLNFVIKSKQLETSTIICLTRYLARNKYNKELAHQLKSEYCRNRIKMPCEECTLCDIFFFIDNEYIDLNYSMYMYIYSFLLQKMGLENSIKLINLD